MNKRKLSPKQWLFFLLVIDARLFMQLDSFKDSLAVYCSVSLQTQSTTQYICPFPPLELLCFEFLSKFCSQIRTDKILIIPAGKLGYCDSREETQIRIDQT